MSDFFDCEQDGRIVDFLLTAKQEHISFWNKGRKERLKIAAATSANSPVLLRSRRGGLHFSGSRMGLQGIVSTRVISAFASHVDLSPAPASKETQSRARPDCLKR